jgi:DNA invertase Pin-like site-specific DNA recombinase
MEAKEPAPVRAATYARRSSGRQGASIDSQQAENRAYCQDRGWLVVGEYRDTASAFKPEARRPDLERLLRDAEAGAFDVLVVREISRLSRREDSESAVAVVWTFRSCGVQVVSRFQPSTGSKMADDMLMLAADHAGREESRTISKRVSEGKRARLLAGVSQGRVRCYGYEREGQRVVDPRTGRSLKLCRADPEQAAVVREIAAMLLDRAMTFSQVADELNRRGVAPPGEVQSRRGQGFWRGTTVRRLSTNPLIAGLVNFRGEAVKTCACASLEQPAAWRSCPHDYVRSTQVPGILDLETWTRLRSLVDLARSHGPGNHSGRGSRPETTDRFLLAGMFFCACGERMSVVSKVDAYRCIGRRDRTCDMPTLKRAEVDEAVRKVFVRQRCVDVGQTIARWRERIEALRSSEAGTIREELAEAERDHADARALRHKALADYQAGELPARAYARVDEEAEAREAMAQRAKERLRARLAKVEGPTSAVELDALLDRLTAVQRIISGELHEADVPQLRRKLAEVFASFEVRREGASMTIEPKLRDEDPMTFVADFSEGEAEGLQVVEDLEPVLSRIDLLDCLESRKVWTAH